MEQYSARLYRKFRISYRENSTVVWPQVTRPISRNFASLEKLNVWQLSHFPKYGPITSGT